MIGLITGNFMILTNQKACQKASIVLRGLKIKGNLACFPGRTFFSSPAVVTLISRFCTTNRQSNGFFLALLTADWARLQTHARKSSVAMNNGANVTLCQSPFKGPVDLSLKMGRGDEQKPLMHCIRQVSILISDLQKYHLS